MTHRDRLLDAPNERDILNWRRDSDRARVLRLPRGGQPARGAVSLGYWDDAETDYDHACERLAEGAAHPRMSGRIQLGAAFLSSRSA
jgi:hypothetical protein